MQAEAGTAYPSKLLYLLRLEGLKKPAISSRGRQRREHYLVVENTVQRLFETTQRSFFSWELSGLPLKYKVADMCTRSRIPCGFVILLCTHQLQPKIYFVKNGVASLLAREANEHPPAQARS